MGTTIRAAAPGDWERLRDLRLRALADTPDAFGSTHAETVGRPDTFWQDWAAGRSRDGGIGRTFVAIDGDRWVGMAFGLVPADDRTMAFLHAMWVAPETRRQGVAAALVDAVLAWAREQDVARVELWVTETNPGARRLYERLGFTPTGDRKPLREGTDLITVGMSRTLA